MPSSPGTVSKILWHFTGGPRWDNELNKQDREPKPVSEAYDTLLKIVASKCLLIGRYKEVVHVLNPYCEQVGPGRIIVDPDRMVTEVIYSMPTNCVADIPIMHLGYHSGRYGKVAIGFRRESVVAAGFSPVFYQLVGSDHLLMIQSLVNCLEALERSRRRENEKSPGGRIYPEGSLGYHLDKDGNWKPNSDPIEEEIGQLQQYSGSILAYVKTFTSEEFDSIYTEREWRSTKQFDFDFKDVPMIVVPREDGFFDRLIAEADSLGLPRSVSIVAWEDLVEH